MSFEYKLESLGFLTSDSNLDPYAYPTAGTDYQYKAVKMAGNGQFTPVTAIGDVVIGILQTHPGLDEAGEVAHKGVSKVVAGGVVTEAAPVYLLADGTVADSSAAGARFIGTAMASGIAGDIVPVLLAELNATTAVQS